MVKTSRLLAFSIVLLLILTAVNAWAQQESIGKIIALRGVARAEQPGAAPRVLSLSGPVFKADRIQTEATGRIQILFLDSTIVSLGPDSKLEIAAYAFDKATGKGEMKTRVSEGVFRVLGGAITSGSPEKFVTETPAATIGIRGSSYRGAVQGGRLSVVFQAGRGIYVRNPAGMVEISSPGFGTRVEGPAQAPQEPFRFTPQDLREVETPEEQAGQAETSGESAQSVQSGQDAGQGQTSPASSPAPEPQDVPTAPPSPVDPTVTGPQDQLPEALQPPTDGGTTPLPKAVSGQFLAVQDDQQSSAAVADKTWAGPVGGQTLSGKLNVQVDTSAGTLVVDEMTTAAYDPTASYTGYTKIQGGTRNLTLEGSPRVFSTAEFGYDSSTGAFTVFTLDEVFGPTAGSYSYRELGFAGVPTSTLPTTGIDEYHGPILGWVDNVNIEDFSAISDAFTMQVNWHNGKAIGLITGDTLDTPGPKTLGFFFGSVTGSGASFQFIGQDIVGKGTATGSASPGLTMPLSIEGSSTFGQFYGAEAQGFGFTAFGQTYKVLEQTLEENWQVIGGGFQTTGLIKTVGSGTAVWEGFMVGVADDMNQPDQNRRIFMNQSPSDFTLTVDKDAGTLTGTLDAPDVDGSGTNLVGLQIGGALGSAYVADNMVAAVIGGASPVVTGNANAALKTHGNYFVSQDPSKPLANYASWGIWEAAFEEPGSLRNYHVHLPGSLWIAGERTPTAEVQALIDTNFTATYLGRAEGVQIPLAGPFSALTGGLSTVTLDFGAGASVPVSGSMVFDQGSINFFGSPSSLTTSGFTGFITTPGYGQVQGAFFGPGAASVGGNFDAHLSSGDRWVGVFGGNR